MGNNNLRIVVSSKEKAYNTTREGYTGLFNFWSKVLFFKLSDMDILFPILFFIPFCLKYFNVILMD